MNQQIATTSEQSRRLLACGLDPKSADMCYLYWDESGEQLSREVYLEIFNESFLDGRIELVPKDFGDYDHSYENDSPAWSLSRLLSLLPKVITCDAYGYIWLEIVWLYEENSIPTIRYFTPPNENDDEPDQWEFTDDSIIECAVQAVEWIRDNGYKLNEIKQ